MKSAIAKRQSAIAPDLHGLARFAVGCEGELIDAFPDAAAALRFAEWSVSVTDCRHEIFCGTTGAALVILEPLRAA